MQLVLLTSLDAFEGGAASATVPRAVAACTGASTALPADQCAAWQAFWDGAGGDKGWTLYGVDCARTDPCKQGCGHDPVCNGAGTTVISMCVPAPVRPPPSRSLRCR